METILVVEDSRPMQRTLQRLFEADSLNVKIASDGLAGLEHVVDLRRLFAACLGEVRPAAPGPADDGGDFLDDLAGLDPPGQV